MKNTFLDNLCFFCEMLIGFPFQIISWIVCTIHIKAMPSSLWDVHKKYQRYYREKLLEWRELDKPIRMSYKNRPVPDFIADLITTI